MTLIKTSLLNGIAVVIKMITLLGLNKILAIYVGPSGYAALGQFQNAVQIITTFASGAINTGVIKYTAEYYEDEEKQHAVWRTAGTIAFTGSLITVILVILFNRTLAGWFLKDEALGSVFIWFASTLMLFVFNTLLLAILNGKKEIRRYVIANIAGSLFALIVTSVMAMQLGIYGALIALAIYQSLTFFVTLGVTYKASWFKLSYLFGGIDRQAAKQLAKYTVMALTSVVCVPISHILIRNHLGETLGWDVAGYWEAMWRLSSAYLMLVTTTLGVYYLPKLSELQNPADIKREILQGYKIILPAAAAFGVIIYLQRDLIINVLFSAEFTPMEPMFFWQMVGDFLMIASWIMGYVLAAKAYIFTHMIFQIVFPAFFFFLVMHFSEKFGIEGAAIAHVVTYSFHIVAMFFVLKMKRIF